MADNTDLVSADRAARLKALDVAGSYIVQAPAGSGKTELLIQRYLKLLALVNDPEEVVAITFTRKAAGEMRFRVLEALATALQGTPPVKSHERITYDAAMSVLERDRALGWQLTEFPRRMRIQTLDALGAGIARSMPLSSALGGTPQTLADSGMQSIYNAAAASTLDWLATSDRMRNVVERVLVHLDNNAGDYIEYLTRMLETRDQWLGIVGAGVSGEEEFSAVRTELEQGIFELVEERLATVSELMPVGLSGAIASLADYAAQNVKKTNPEHPIAALAGLIKLPAADPELRNVWSGVAELLLTRDGQWRRRIDKTIGFPPQDNGEKNEFRALLAGLEDEHELAQRLHKVRQLPAHRYGDEQWDVLIALLNLLPLAVTELRRVFGERGVVDHTEVALAANLALGSADDPGDMALLLDYQIRHLLIDEMQDTSISQYHFLEKLVAGWQEGDGRTLFCVGDPMQSIYRFRNAEVGQFLVAREKGIAGLAIEPLLLRRNFRSGENLVNWFNETFRQTLPAEDNISAGSISYADAVSVEDRAGQGECRIHPVFGSDKTVEAERGAAILNAALSADNNDTIAVLVRSRTTLPGLLSELRKQNISYQAVEIDRLTDLPEIIDILALTRAMIHDGDRIAWLALLRGPWVGLNWTDLHAIVRNDSASTVWDLIHSDDRITRLNDDAASRVAAFSQTMQKQLGANATRSLRDRVEAAWFALGGPALLKDQEEVDNVYRFLAVIGKIETAGTLADTAELGAMLDEERVSSSATSACRLQVMTMHRAKGLQFDQVLLFGLGRVAGSPQKSVLSWLRIPGQSGAGDMLISPVGPRSEIEHDPLHRFIEVSENDKDRLEQDRLLYVACTRAKKILHLLGHVPLAPDGDTFRPPQAASLLRRIWPAISPAYEKAFESENVSARDHPDTTLLKPSFRRFARQWRLPEAPPPPRPFVTNLSDETDDNQVEYYWVGSSARHAGTIVHRWLQQAAEGSVQLDADKLSDLRTVNERWSARLGAAADDVSRICDRVEEALRGILTDEKGLWTLAGEGQTEIAVTGLWKGRVESIIIDRIRVDDDGVHWIVDYKTSSHEGGDLEGFLSQESERYKAQLQKYAELYAGLTKAPVRTALYFPLLQEFVEVECVQS